MITVNNYKAKAKTIDFLKLPNALRKSHKNFDVMVKHYDNNATIKKVIDLYLKKLNKVLKDNKPSKKATKPKTTKKTVSKKKTSVKKSSSKSIKPSIKKVENIGIEIRYIKRFVLLHGKIKSKKQILTFLASLQNSMLKKEIRKSSSFAKEIEHIQEELISLIGFYGKSINSKIDISIKDATLKKYKSLAYSEKVMPAIKFIAQYNRLHGKANVKTKAKSLLSQIDKALKDGKIKHYQKELKEVQTTLKKYVGNKDILMVEDINLKGIPSKKKDSQIVSSTNFAKHRNFKALGFTGKWLQLIGNPVEPFSMMTYAKPGQGKSTLNLDFAHYLASKHNKKVLFVADEEKLGYTLQEKIKRLKASHPNLFITGRMPSNIKAYHFVFLDSVNSIRLMPEDLQLLSAKNPKISFIYVFQSTKNGNFKGSQEYSHDVDVVIETDQGIAKTEKSRFGGSGEVKVW